MQDWGAECIPNEVSCRGFVGQLPRNALSTLGITGVARSRAIKSVERSETPEDPRLHVYVATSLLSTEVAIKCSKDMETHRVSKFQWESYLPVCL